MTNRPDILSTPESGGDIEDRKSDDLLEDQVDTVAHLMTGLYGSRCCHITGGLQRDNAKCECRQVARDILSALSKAAPAAGKPKRKPGDIEVRNGIRYRFIEEELEGEKWEVLGPAGPQNPLRSDMQEVKEALEACEQCLNYTLRVLSERHGNEEDPDFDPIWAAYMAKKRALTHLNTAASTGGEG